MIATAHAIFFLIGKLLHNHAPLTRHAFNLGLSRVAYGPFATPSKVYATEISSVSRSSELRFGKLNEILRIVMMQNMLHSWNSWFELNHNLNNLILFYTQAHLDRMMPSLFRIEQAQAGGRGCVYWIQPFKISSLTGSSWLTVACVWNLVSFRFVSQTTVSLFDCHPLTHR